VYPSRLLGLLGLVLVACFLNCGSPRRESSQAPFSESPEVQQARQLLRQGDFNSASNLFDQALANDPRDTSALLGIVTLLIRQNQIEKAESRVKEFQREVPDSPAAQLALAQIAFRRKNLKLAGDLLDAATARSPREPTFHIAAAYLYQNLGRGYRGETLLTKAWKEGMADAEALELLGNLCLKMLLPERAEAALRAALEAGADSAEIHRNLGRALVMLDRRVEAGREFETAVKMGPSDPYSLYYLGFLRMEEGKSAEAAQLLVKSLEGDALNPQAQYAAGRALMQMGEVEAAKSHFTRHSELMERLYHRPVSAEGGNGAKGEWVRWDAAVENEPEESGVAGSVAPGRYHFVDVAREAGIQLKNVSGGPDKDYIVESLGNGACWLDYDRDGWLDLFLPNGLPMTPGTGESPRDALYRNRRDGTFQDVTASSGIRDTGWGHGCAVGDVDNDGDPDLYVTNRGPNALFLNRGDGTFAEVAHAPWVDDPHWSTSAAFADYDNDGWLDLFVANYVVFDLASTPRPGSGEFCRWHNMPAFCGPRGLPPDRSRLYRGTGKGRFQDVTDPAGIKTARGAYSLGVVWGDVENDGDADLVVAADSTPNLLFLNLGNGTFREQGTEAGVAYNEEGREQAGMGVDMADYDNDQDLDVIVTNFSHDTNTLRRQDSPGTFTDVTFASGVGPPSYLSLGWGVGFVDLDNDGWKDIFVANGHTQPQVDTYDQGTRYRQRKLLHVNLGNGKFEEAAAVAGPGLMTETPGRGAAFADFDNDGDIDILVNNIDETPSLLRNDTGNHSHWIGLRLIGRSCNRDAIGARVTLRSEKSIQVAEVRPGYSYLSSNDPRILFGLGPSPVPAHREIRIRWPGGGEQIVRDPPLDAYTTIRQAD